PQQVENVLMTHPAVAEAAVFPFPDRSLGEEIGAAVVLRSQQTANERDLANYVMEQLDENRAPPRIVFLDSLPPTAAGKTPRIDMAERLGLTANTQPDATPSFTPPTTSLEKQIVAIWAGILGRPVESIGIHNTFRDSGGDSIAATRLVVAMHRLLNV